MLFTALPRPRRRRPPECVTDAIARPDTKYGQRGCIAVISYYVPTRNGTLAISSTGSIRPRTVADTIERILARGYQIRGVGIRRWYGGIAL